MSLSVFVCGECNGIWSHFKLDGNNQPKQLTEKDGALYWDTVYKVSICDTKGTGAPLCVKRGKCCCDLVNFYQNCNNFNQIFYLQNHIFIGTL